MKTSRLGLSAFAVFSVLTLSVSAFADRTCHFAGGSQGAGGSSSDTLTILSISSSEINTTNTVDDEYNGSHPRTEKDQTVHGKDGHLYYNYDAGMGDGALQVLATPSLMDAENPGIVKLRRSGGDGGVSDLIFHCPAQN